MTDTTPPTPPTGPRLRRLATPDLTAAETAAVRTLLEAAFGDEEDERFTEADWQHSVGGTHCILDLGGAIIAHAAVVTRDIHVGNRPLRTAYVEAVAVAPQAQGHGHGTTLMRDVNALITAGYALGVLGTGSHHFYERLGWRTWRGPAAVRTKDGDRPTPDDDGFLMVLGTATSPELDFDAPISCEWRPGDVW